MVDKSLAKQGRTSLVSTCGSGLGSFDEGLTADGKQRHIRQGEGTGPEAYEVRLLEVLVYVTKQQHALELNGYLAVHGLCLTF